MLCTFFFLWDFYNDYIGRLDGVPQIPLDSVHSYSFFSFYSWLSNLKRPIFKFVYCSSCSDLLLSFCSIFFISVTLLNSIFGSFYDLCSNDILILFRQYFPVSISFPLTLKTLRCFCDLCLVIIIFGLHSYEWWYFCVDLFYLFECAIFSCFFLYFVFLFFCFFFLVVNSVKFYNMVTWKRYLFLFQSSFRLFWAKDQSNVKLMDFSGFFWTCVFPLQCVVSF